MNFSLNQKGVSLVQLIIAIAISALVAAAIMKQTVQSQKQVKEFQRSAEIDNFFNEISKSLSIKKNCDHNFATKAPTINTIAFIEALDVNDVAFKILEKNKKYLAKAITINNIELEPNTQAGILNLIVTFTKEYTKKGYTEVKKTILLSADHDGATINSCLFDLNNYTDSVIVDAAKACQGPGVEIITDINGNDICHFKHFSPTTAYSELSCGGGYALGSLTYNPVTFTYEVTCNAVYTNPGSCPAKRIQSIAPNGAITCLNMVDITDATPTTFGDGSPCNVQVSAGKLQLVCGGAVACVPSCPAANSICSGQNFNGSDGCGGNCNVTGTGTCCTNGKEKGGALLSHTQDYSYCPLGGPPASGDIWKHQRQKCISGSWVNQTGTCWKRTQYHCDPPTPTPPSNSPGDPVLSPEWSCSTGSTDPCSSNINHPHFQQTTGIGTFNFCRWRY